MLNCCWCVEFGLKVDGVAAVVFWMLGGGIAVLGKIEAKLIKGANWIFPVGLHIIDRGFPALENSISSTVTYRTDCEQIVVAG